MEQKVGFQITIRILNVNILQWSVWISMSEWIEDRNSWNGTDGNRRCKGLLWYLLSLNPRHILSSLMLLAFGCEISGLVSSPREPSENDSKYFTVDNITEMLSSVDYLINVLPATPQTDNILSRLTLRVQIQVIFVSILQRKIKCLWQCRLRKHW